jgi:hypothetical protein
MLKGLNILFIILILIFALSTFKYYSSNKNLQIKDFNRNNINQIINQKISNLSVLENNTNNVIEFNNSFKDEIINKKSRSFWNLLK